MSSQTPDETRPIRRAKPYDPLADVRGLIVIYRRRRTRRRIITVVVSVLAIIVVVVVFR